MTQLPVDSGPFDPLSDEEMHSLGFTRTPGGGWRPPDRSPSPNDQEPSEGRLLHRLDWPKLLADGAPEIEFLLEPYLPQGARVLVVGAASVGKSLWAAHVGAELSRGGHRIVYIDQENPLPESLRRFHYLRPHPELFEVYHFCGIDLTNPAHSTEVLEACEGSDFAIVDTLSACSSGDENDNVAFATFDRDVMLPIIAKGTTFMLIDHTGNPQPLVRRRGVNAPRGASSKAQKCDVVLEFRQAGQGFTIVHAKARMGGRLEKPATFRFEDAEDGSIEVVPIDQQDDLGVARERAIALVEARPDSFTKSSLAQRLDMRRQEGLGVVGGLVEAGVLGPDKPRARLRVIGDGSGGNS